MQFAERLDFFMNITKTSNSVLARAVALDASYISRLRNGHRLMPKNTAVIAGMAACFARRCTGDIQKKAISDALQLPVFPAPQALATTIARWLTDKETGIERFLGGLAGLGDKLPERQNLPTASASGTCLFYGVEGKRKAAESFLAEVAAEAAPQTLLLYSDESTSWMTADPHFTARWAALMARVLGKGNRIRIIHTISRDLDEMLTAISQWMPLYMSGLIEPFFYPKKRDGIFHNTLFIAPHTVAVASQSIGEQIASAVNLLTHEKEAIQGYSEEFNQYLALCRPLMRIYTAADYDNCQAALRAFELTDSNTLLCTESISQLTMPEELVVQILNRSGLAQAKLLAMHRNRSRHFKKLLEKHLFCEIITLPEPGMLKAGKIKVAMAEMLGGGAMYYTQAEYIRHLQQLVKLLKAQPRFRVYPVKRAESSYMVYAREDSGVLVGKTSQPPVVLHMTESNITAAFWDFLKSTIGEREFAEYDRQGAIRTLQNYILENK